MTKILTTGFYTSDRDHCTVYVTPKGRIFCVESDDLVGRPREWDAAADLAGYLPAEGLNLSEYGPGMVAEIEAASGEILS